MSNSALDIWKSIYKNGVASDSTSFLAIDLLLNGFSQKEKTQILNEVFATFKSTFVAYRFIYFNFIKEDIPEDEQVKIVNPYDLPSLDVKIDENFKKRTKNLTSGFKSGVSTCPFCNSTVYDNRFNKRNPKAPDFKCSAKSRKECSAHDGRFAKGWWLDSRDLPPEWSTSTSVVYDDVEKDGFKQFCIEQVKKVYPKLKETYRYSHLEKKLINSVWIDKKDSQLIEKLKEPELNFKNYISKITFWRSDEELIHDDPSTGSKDEPTSYPDGGYRNTKEHKRISEKDETFNLNISESSARSRVSELKTHPHLIKKYTILEFAERFNISFGWKNKKNNTKYGGSTDTSKDLTMGAVYPLY